MPVSPNLLYLASQSPRRRQLLTRMGVPFRVVPSRYEERLRQGVDPAVLALEHAEGKARHAVLPRGARFVLGADTVVACAGRLLGKPRNERDALAMIRFLAGRKNEVITGLALLDLQTGILTRSASRSIVKIKKMNASERLAYVRSAAHPYDKAGGYAIQGSPRIARRVSGSYSNIIGFPRELMRRLLKQAGLFLLGLFLIQAGPETVLADTMAGPVRSAHTEAALVSETNGIQPGGMLRVALRLRMDPQWHTYWINPGDSGLGTSLRWTLPESFSAGSIQWPFPEIIRRPPLATYGYENEVWLFTEITAPAYLKTGENILIRVRADWLECAEPCLPGRAEFSLELPVLEQPAANPAWDQGALPFLARLPQPLPPEVFSFEQTEGALILKISPRLFPSPQAVEDAYFFPWDSELIEHAAPQTLTQTPAAYSLEIPRSRLKPGLVEELAGVLVLTIDGKKQAYEVSLTEKDLLQDIKPQASVVAIHELPLRDDAKKIPFAASVRAKSTSFWVVLAFAFLGGLILNLMPCVLPVLSLKILGFVSQRHEPEKLRTHGLIWTGGVLVSFWLLSAAMLVLRWGGSSLGWGFQLQSPVIVTALLLIFALLTLNLAGFFEVGLLLTRFGGTARPEKNGQAFAAGVLAVAAATPCAAPFMGAAIGYALTQPVPVVFAVFTFLGLGMAFPFLLLSFVPRALGFLPKPGPWMNTFKKVLALPLGLTTVWLGWVLAVQVDAAALKWIFGAILSCAAAAILYGRFQHAGYRGKAGAHRLSGMALAALVAGAAATLWLAHQTARPQPAAAKETGGIAWKTFSREEVSRLVQEGRPVFIDFTARWCLSCQVNDRLVFQTPRVAQAFQEKGISVFKADWTSKDTAIAEALAGYGRASVPLYVLYDGKNPAPRFLPEVLTPGLVIEALEKDSGNR